MLSLPRAGLAALLIAGSLVGCGDDGDAGDDPDGPLPTLFDPHPEAVNVLSIDLALRGRDGLLVWHAAPDATGSTQAREAWAVHLDLDGGWGEPERLSGDDFVHRPLVALDAAGRGLATWQSVPTGVSRWDRASGWVPVEPPAIVCPETEPFCKPNPVAIALRASGDGFVAFDGAEAQGVWLVPWSPDAGWGEASWIEVLRGIIDLELAVDAVGGALALFHVYTNAGYEVLATENVGDGWTPPKALTGEVLDYQRPRLAMNEAGQAIMLHRRDDRVLAWRWNATGSWAAAEDVGSLGPIGRQPGPSIAVTLDASGRATAIWRVWDSGDVVASQQGPGEAWRDPSRVTAGPIWDLEAAVSADGHITTVFTEPITSNREAVWMASSADGVSWERVRISGGELPGVESPRVVATTDGEVLAAWLGKVSSTVERHRVWAARP